jgi:predicted PurR-regulated permease PerM
LPKIQQKVAGQLSSVGPLQKALQNGIHAGGGSDTQQMLGKGLNAVKSTLGGMVDFVLVLILAIYFISDGPRALRWIIGYFRPGDRERVSRGLEEIGNRIVAYTIGQSIISAKPGVVAA